MLLFFAISGIWQMFNLHHAHSEILTRLSTIHTSHQLKTGGSLTSFFMKAFVLAMTASFILSTILGVVLAIKHGKNRRMAFYCLAVGVILPLIIVFVGALIV